MELDISKAAKQLLEQSWRGKARKQYQGYIQKWNKFCYKGQTNPGVPELRSSKSIRFFKQLFESGLGYSAINTARSSLSTILSLDGSPIGQHPLVIGLLKGVLNSRPSFPKTNITWDPKLC